MIEFDTDRDLIGKSGGPDMTPMIDMVFLLLIFFLLTSIILRPVLEVDLPESETAETEETRGTTVSVRENGDLFLNGGETGFDSLPGKLTAALLESGSGSVVVQADRGVDFEVIVRIMDIARRSRADSVSFVVRDR
jgi:biopolymer transport protein ExbD